MRIKSLLLTIALCGVVGVAMAKNTAAVDTTEMGVHPYKDTHNLTWNTTGYSLVFHGGINFYNGDYPTNRFNTLGYPSAGIALEYNFTPVWGIGLGYNFAMPQVTTKRDEAGFLMLNPDNSLSSLSLSKGDLVHRGMLHSGQVYVTFNLINAWFPRAVQDVFGLTIFAGVGSSWYKNSVSFSEIPDENGELNDSRKYVKDDDNSHAHSKYAQVAYAPLGAIAEFNVSRQVSLGVRFQYDMYFNDYVDNRYQDKANKNNDGMFELELMLRWKIAAKKKNHLRNVASVEVLEEKYYQSHPNRRKRNHAVDTVLFYHRDTIVVIHRDTVVMATPTAVPAEAPVVVEPQPAPQGRCDLTLYPGWEAEADAVVVEGQSLSQLARKYYKNTFCWVYLWIANRSIAPDPNLIMPKCVLKVPRLNACQLSITKQEAKDMCASYRGE